VVSIFVNPTQFAPGEDLDRYPRDEERDIRLLEERDIDLLFLPSVSEIYPEGSATSVRVKGVAEPLEGERRPGHFDGVATVVLKLFNIVSPDVAVFGQKDAQQCAVIRQMVRDLDVPVELVIGETVREGDGLAMSSRNVYLSEDQRKLALVLRRALERGVDSLRAGARETRVVEEAMAAEVDGRDGVQIDYLALVDPETFRRPADLDRPLLLAGAVRLGATRLIDNIPVAFTADRNSSPGERLQTTLA
jgi:pantoate--beta-alanine ligase